MGNKSFIPVSASDLPVETIISLMPDYSVMEHTLYFMERQERPLSLLQTAFLESCDQKSNFSIKQAQEKFGMWGTEFASALGLLGYVAYKTPSTLTNSLSNLSVLVISPHMDDGFFSLAGVILAFSRKAHFFILDLFGDDPWSAFHERYWPERQQLIRIRSQEEFFSAWLCDCQVQILGHPSAPHRGHRIWNEPLDPLLDSTLLRQLIDDIENVLMQNTWDLIFWPLGIGGHVDHRLVRQLAFQFVQRNHLSSRRFVYYEDLPYAASPAHWKTWPSPELLVSLKPAYIPISSQLAKKRQLLDVYRSQLLPNEPNSICKYANSAEMLTGIPEIDKTHLQRTASSEESYERVWCTQESEVICSHLLSK
ncbi:2'-N-acetylparomamine deacetylase [Anaerolineae bacterium]|nr:2'-N-acetylparomamine deacetylase [Anaerolineae bacterium]